MTIWTLITILGDGSGSIQNGHPNAAVYGGTFTFVGTLLGQNVYAVCSLHRPQIDSSGALWIQGDPSVVAPGYIPSANPVPTCNALEPCCDHIVDPIIFTPTPPVSLPFNGVDCAGAPLPTTANSSVFITGTQAPIPVCITGATTDTRIDFEIGCSSIDGRTILLIVESTGGIITSGLFETDGVTPVADGSILVKCDIDIEDVEFCFQDITDTTIRYRQVVFVNTATNAVVSTIWIDSTGVAIAAPSNIEPCADADEIDLLHTNWLPICVDGVQWYVAEDFTFNNTTQAKSLIGKIYKIGANGVPNTNPPIGTIIDGFCKECKKEIFATHDRYISVPSTGTSPNGVTGFDFDLPVDFGTTDATDTYFHVFCTNVGCHFYPPATTNPTTPILIAGNVAIINTHIQNSLIADGFVGNEIELIVNADNSITIWVSNTYTPSGSEFWFGTITPDAYTNKLFPAIPTTYPYPSENVCVAIQEIKERDSCTGEETYRYVIENTLGSLVAVTDVYPNFVESDILLKCPSYIYNEKEVCAKIDNSVDIFEIIRVDKRNADTYELVNQKYETKKGIHITGLIEEVCCNCDTLCTYSPQLLNRICFGYNGLFNGDTQFPSDKANFGADMFIEYFEVDGNVLVNSSTSIGSTGTATFSDVGYGIAYDSVVNVLNTSILGSNDLEFVPAGNVVTDRGWGVKYNDAKSYRIVISDFIPNSGATAYWTIVINPTEQWDGLGNAIPGGHWTQVDYQNNIGNAFNMSGCASL